MTAGYRVSVFMTAVDIEKGRQLREALGRVMKGLGKEPLRDLMRRANEGERILVYQTNDDRDAQGHAQPLIDAGATIEIEGLKPPEEPF